MRIVSVNVGRPQEVEWQGRRVRTSIWKTPVAGAVAVGAVNLAGDEQSDLSVHGGAAKAVYAYPMEHYAFWRHELGRDDLAWGIFGENLTTEGVLESDIAIGDRLRIGSSEFVVTQPRQPCFKLGIRFGDDRMLKRFLESGRSGFYLSIARTGTLAAGDAIEWVAREPHHVTIADAVAIKAGTKGSDAGTASPRARRSSAARGLEGLSPKGIAAERLTGGSSVECRLGSGAPKIR